MSSASKRLKIAQICPLWEQVPPKGYGGIEMIVSLLTENLVRRGHDVTLFASGDSQTSGKLVSPCPYAIRHDPDNQSDNMWRLNRKNMALEQLQLKRLYQGPNAFDIVHSHLELTALPFAASSPMPTVHTMHMDLVSETQQLLLEYWDQYFVSISDAQREPCPSLNYVRTIYNAIDMRGFKFYPEAQEPKYMAFLGRLSPEKGVHHAIELSKKTGIPLKFAGKHGQEDTDYYEGVVQPQIDGKQIQYLGEIDDQGKIELLGNAFVTVFPITWREPFGLVMVESMACGTPVLGMNLGAVPEVIAQGKSGFVCDTVVEMLEKMSKIESLNRHDCRQYVEERFGVKRMLDDYEACYQFILQTHESSP